MIDLLKPFRVMILMAADYIRESEIKEQSRKEQQTAESIEYYMLKAEEKRRRRAEKLRRIKAEAEREDIK